MRLLGRPGRRAAPRVELVRGEELSGPAGAFALVAGAAYVPSGAEPWYGPTYNVAQCADRVVTGALSPAAQVSAAGGS
jgi:hypothetical protein